MLKKVLFIFLGACCVVLTSCDLSKRYVKEADRLAAAGNYEDAANYYYNALLINPKNVLAQNGMKKTGQQVLDAKFTGFSRFVVENNIEEAVKQYRYNQKYYEKVKVTGVELEWHSEFNSLYDELKGEYISKLYDNGLNLMKQNKYDKAEALFSKVVEIDSGFKDVTVLRLNSVMEPLYQQGMAYMQTANYKSAYRNFSKVLSNDAAFKNARQLQQEALAKATVSIGVLMVNEVRYPGAEDVKLYQQVLAEMVAKPSPFLKVVDRSIIEKLLKEQELGMSGMLNPQTAAKAGKLLGLNYFLLVDMSELNYNEQKPTVDSAVAYEAFSEKITDPATGSTQNLTRFKKVNYREIHQFRQVASRVFYRLISVETSQIVASEVVLSEKRDEQNYARYDGNYMQLYPYLPAANYLPAPPKEWREKFSTTKRELLSNEVLGKAAFDEIAAKIAEDINLYIEK